MELVEIHLAVVTVVMVEIAHSTERLLREAVAALDHKVLVLVDLEDPVVEQLEVHLLLVHQLKEILEV